VQKYAFAFLFAKDPSKLMLFYIYNSNFIYAYPLKPLNKSKLFSYLVRNLTITGKYGNQ